MQAFRAPPRQRSDWFSAGRVSSFPDLVAQPLLCKGDAIPGCKVFHVPKEDASQGAEVPVDGIGGDLKDQVLVFRFRGKFHALDHACPHSSYPLSQGIVFDVEDFGVVLSAGITCPKHSWSFDLFTGNADHGPYKIVVWEVQLRDVAQEAPSETPSDKDSAASRATEQAVWVRRKPRIG